MEPFPVMDLFPELRRLIWQQLDHGCITRIAATCRAIRRETEPFQVPRYLICECRFKSANVWCPNGDDCVQHFDRARYRQMMGDMLMAIVGIHPRLFRIVPTSKIMYRSPIVHLGYDEPTLRYVWENETHYIKITLQPSYFQFWFRRLKRFPPDMHKLPVERCSHDEAIQSLLTNCD
jgi:hypothetical protein